MRLLTSLLLMAVALPAAADLKVQDLTLKLDDWQAYRFPLFEGDTPAIKAINTYLHAVDLNSLPGRFKRSPFEQVQPEDGTTFGLVNLDYTLVAQTPAFLALKVDGEYMSAHSNRYSFSYNFNLHDGTLIGLDQVITPAGLAQLSAAIQEEREQRIDQFLASLSAATAEDQEQVDGQRRLYRGCRVQLRESGLAYDELQLERDGLTLTANACGGYGDQALDELGEFTHRFSYVQLKEQLSGYGRCLLIEQRSDCQAAPTAYPVGVYTGQLGGRYPITLVIREPKGDSAQGVYFYDKVATHIDLDVKRSAVGHYLLHESSEPSADFDLRLQADGSLVGTWQQQGKKPLDVRLTR